MPRINRTGHKRRVGGPPGPRGKELLPPPATAVEARQRAAGASNDDLAAAIRYLDEHGDSDESFRSFGAEYAYRDELDARFSVRLNAGPFTAAEVKEWTRLIPDPANVFPASDTVASKVAWFAKRWKTGATVTTMPPPPAGDAA